MKPDDQPNWTRPSHGNPTGKEPASWRGGGKRKPEGSGSSFLTWWRTGGSHEKYKHTVRLVLYFGAIVILGIVLYLIWPKHKQTPFVVLSISDHDSVLVPPNAMALEDDRWYYSLWAREDADGKRQTRDLGYWGDADRNHHETSEYVAHLNQQFSAPNFRPGGPDKNVVLIYISAHGVTDSKGDPCLLMSDSDPRDERTWVRVKDVLAAITSNEHLREFGGKPVRKVVFLDASRMLYDLHLGVLYNAFNERVKNIVQTIGDVNLAVVNSASAGEVAWHAPEYNRSVFGHFLGRGLSGVEFTTAEPKKVTLGELADYLKSRVSTWVRDHRISAQHPEVHAIGPDWQTWRLVYTSPQSETLAAALTRHDAVPPKIQSRSTALDTLWQSYDKRVDLKTYHVAPMELAELHFRLARLEQLLVAGMAYETAFDSGVKAAHEQLEAMGQLATPLSAVALSTPLALCSQPADEQRHFSEQWKTASNSAQWEDVAFPRDVVAAGLVQWLVARHAKLDDLDQLNDLLKMIDKTPGGDHPDFVEVNLLRMLNKHLDHGAIKKTEPVEKAVLTRCLAEQAAAPADERAHYWIQARVNQADQQRRLAEDQLLVGTTRALQAADPNWTALLDPTNGPYQQAQEHGAQIARAYAIRDRAWALLPDLTKWLIVKAHYRARQVTQQEFTVLVELAQNTRELSDQLDRPFRIFHGDSSDPAQTETEWHDRSGRIAAIAQLAFGPGGIEETVEGLLTDFREAWQQQRTQQDKTVVALWGAMLQVPLAGPSGIAGTARNIRRSRHLKLLFLPDDTHDAGIETEAPSEAKQVEGDSMVSADATIANNTHLLDLLGNVSIHPALAILTTAGIELEPAVTAEEGPEDSAEKRIRFLARQSGQFREHLVQGSLADVRLDEIDMQQIVRQQRMDLSRADQTLRAAAGFRGVLPDNRHGSPTLILRRLDRHYFFLWQADRALLDLWNDSESGTPPYYLQAFDAYADAAETVYPMYEKRYQYDGLDLGAKRNQLREQLDNQQLTTPHVRDDPTLIPGSGFVELAVSADQLPDAQGCEPFFSVHIPGDAADMPGLRLSAPSTGAIDVRRVGIPLRTQGEESPVTVRIQQDQFGKQVKLNTTGFFRGRQRLTQVVVPSPTFDITYTLQKQEPPKPTVKLHGSLEKRVAILFVLDCSKSMADPWGEAAGNKLDGATGALDEILHSLMQIRQADDEYFIGLLAFSHRVGVENGRRSPSPSYAEALKAAGQTLSLGPNDDVELVIPFDDPMNPLGDQLLEKITGRFRAWEPRGNTPLYYSINQALEAFAAAPGAASKHLIVITDGQNDLRGTAPEWVRQVTPESLRTKVSDGYRELIINVLGIGMDSFSALETVNEFSLSKGGFYKVTDKSDLLRNIESALGVGDYTVQDQKKRLQPLRQRINETCQILRWDRTDVYDVAMPDLIRQTQPARLLVEGGEAFELFFDSVSNRIQHRRYAPEKRRPTTATAQGAFVSALYPQRQGNRVTFTMTIQNQDARKFSPRPIGVWAAITPMRSETQGQVAPAYHFCDRRFEFGTPVPVLQFTIDQWPPEAQWAQIELWYRVTNEPDLSFTDIPADEEQDLLTAREIPAFPVPNVEATFSVVQESIERGTGVRVVVSERYQNGIQDVQQACVLTWPPADRIVRSYNRQGSLARHVFEYFGSNRPSRLRITSRKRIQHEYARTDQPVAVKLPDPF